jgi:hypothetical protein
MGNRSRSLGMLAGDALVPSFSGVLMQNRSDFDIGDSVSCLRYYAGWADKIVGQVRSLLFVVHACFLTCAMTEY